MREPVRGVRKVAERAAVLAMQAATMYARGARARERREERSGAVLAARPLPGSCCVVRSGRSVRQRWLAGSGFLSEGFLGEVMQDSFVEGGEGAELGGGEQVDEMPADVVHVLGRCVLDGAASGGQKADHGAQLWRNTDSADNEPRHWIMEVQDLPTLARKIVAATGASEHDVVHAIAKSAGLTLTA